MIFILTAVGIITALILVGEDGLLPGAILGFLLAKVLQLSEKIQLLNNRLSQTEHALSLLQKSQLPDATAILASEAEAPVEPIKPATTMAATADLNRSATQYLDVTSILFPTEPTAPMAAQPVAHGDLAAATDTANAVDSHPPHLADPQQILTTSSNEPAVNPWIGNDVRQSRVWAFAMQYLREGNPVVKIGMVVLFFGFAFLIRHLADQGWFPIEARLAAIGVTGLGLIGIGWRTRHRHFNYGLILQGGGLAVCYLTLFAAMKFAPILSSGQTFAGMLLITCAGVALAVRQQAQILAVFATAGGFLVPLLTSDGS
ncbi:MAG: DUF2339 domain-containing protein, partial [Rheinheimera sp.]